MYNVALFVHILAALLPTFGLWLVHLGHWGYGTGWIDWAIGLYVIAIALGGAGGRRPRQARLLATALAERDDLISDELTALLDDPASRAVNYASLLLVLGILALMVFKP